MVRAKRLYHWSGQSNAHWYGVKIGNLIWSVYKIYSSKAAAESSMKKLKDWLYRVKPHADLRVVKTTHGWAVIQLSPHKQYQIKSTDSHLRLS